MKSFVSRSYRLVVLIYAAFPLLYPLFILFVFEITVGQLATILLSLGFWMVSIVAGITAYGLWDARRWAWYLFILLNAMITYFSAVLVTAHGNADNRLLALLGQYAIQLILLLRIRSELRVPYYIPRIRWWESNPAYKVAFHCEILSPHQDPVKGDILDFSYLGCFVRTMGHFRQNELISVKVNLFGQAFLLPAYVVWRAGEAVTHPKGVGLKFLSRKRGERRALLAAHKRFREIFRLFASSRYLYSPEEFNERLVALFEKPLKLKRPTSESNGFNHEA